MRQPKNFRLKISDSPVWISAISIVLGVILGILTAKQPVLIGAACFAFIIPLYFFTNFEQSILGLLIIRSSLDLFSQQGIPVAFAIGLDLLALLYVALRLLTGQSIQTDKFWWLFAIWVALQSFWVIFLGLGLLGLDPAYTGGAIREWVRLFSWLIVYLLVLQLKYKIPPQHLLSTLFLSLIAPLSAALMQTVLPSSMLPGFLGPKDFGVSADSLESLSRVHGTLGHANGFAKFLFLFICLVVWKLDFVKQRLPWLVLLGMLVFFLVATKSLFALGMLGVFIIAYTAQNLSLWKIISGVLILAVFIGLFTSTDYGMERLGSIANTPLLNSDIDASRAILLQRTFIESNSFNWRVTQWTYLLEAWKTRPIFGYGLHTSSHLTYLRNYAHNDYIKTLAEQGLVGLGIFIAFLGCQLWRIIHTLRKSILGTPHRTYCSILLAIFMAQLIAMLTDNVFSNMTFFIYWWAMFAVLDWDWKQHQQEL